ncbi:MAG: LysM peptidoglycan-binding domain-containing protein [Mesorhizobium sp.]|nr:MAG: LysM peptidoglycan-binding domain-containing protein [Mesorhizobium sp.]
MFWPAALSLAKRAVFVSHCVSGPGSASSRLHPHIIQRFVQEAVHLLAYAGEFLLVLLLRQGAVVFSDFVETHRSGEQDENGRINSELDQLGYRWVEAKIGDNMRRIALSHSVDVTEIVILKMDHIPDSDLIYPGDRIYLPN